MSSDVLSLSGDEDNVTVSLEKTNLSRMRARSVSTPGLSDNSGSSITSDDGGPAKKRKGTDDIDDDSPLTGRHIPAIVRAVVDAISSSDKWAENLDEFMPGLCGFIS